MQCRPWRRFNPLCSLRRRIGDSALSLLTGWRDIGSIPSWSCTGRGSTARDFALRGAELTFVTFWLALFVSHTQTIYGTSLLPRRKKTGRSLVTAHSMANPATIEVEDDDPVVAEYDVYITPEMAEQQLYVLQYINRPPEKKLTKEFGSKPSELRMKKESGFIEVDVPLNIHENFNRAAGVQYGEAMRKTKGFGQKAFGIASGFERTMPRSTNRPGAAGEAAPAAPVATVVDDDNFEEYVTNFEDANEKGHVLNVQIFGGQILPEDGKGPSYMLGAFRDSK